MELDAVVQLVTVLVAASAIVWHQQHNTDKLREDSNAANHQLREDFNAANRQHREDFNKLREDLNKLREDSNAAPRQIRRQHRKPATQPPRTYRNCTPEMPARSIRCSGRVPIDHRKPRT